MKTIGSGTNLKEEIKMNNQNIKDYVLFRDESLTKKIIYDEEKVLAFVLNLKAGQSIPIHKHGTSALIYHVLGGAGELKVNEEIIKLEEGSIGLVAGEDDFSIPKIDQDLSLYVTISPRPEDDRYAASID